MNFDVAGAITDIEVMAAGPGIRLGSYLSKSYGRGRRRKLKGIATVRLPNRALQRAELHWHQAHGIGKRELKIKRYPDL